MASLLLLAAPYRIDGWQIDTSNNCLDTLSVPQEVRYVRNTTSSPMSISEEHQDYSKPQAITGSSSTGPSWTSKFTPLSNSTLVVGVTTGGAPNLGAGRWRKWRNIWINEVGTERWILTGSNPLESATRNRDWWTYDYLEETEGVIPPDPPGGGG